VCFAVKVQAGFYRSFNLRFKQPKKTHAINAILSEFSWKQPVNKQEVLIKLTSGNWKNKGQTTRKKAQAARESLQSDRQMAKKSFATDVITFDLQSVFSIPWLSSNIVYYKRQLSLYNLGIHDCSNETAYIHVWGETTASRGAQEIASCLRKHLASSGHQKSKTDLVLWSDSCSGQNRNIKVALRLLELVQDPSV